MTGGLKRIMTAILVPVLAASTSGCATWYRHSARETFPTPVAAHPLQEIVGVAINANSKAPSAASLSPTQVVENLVRRMREDSMFAQIIFPYSDLAPVDATRVFDVTVTIQEHHHWITNTIKAVLIGGTWFLLTPVLPIHLGLLVDLDVMSTTTEEGVPTRYHYASQYEMYYWIFPRKKVLEAWLEKTQLHAVEHVLNQIKTEDRGRF